nr:hypothetical protein [Tanacetum cinerariifolium]
METIIVQQVAIDEALVPGAQRNFRLQPMSINTPIRFKMDNKKHILDLESFRNILHICPKVQGQSFAELPFEEEILDFTRFLRLSATIRTLTDDLSIPRRNKVNWHYVRDDFMFSTIKLVSRHQNTQQFGSLLPIELTTKEIRNSKAYKEYHSITIGEAAPKPKASARRTRSGSDTSITPPTATATPRPTANATPRLTAATKGKQTAKAPKAKKSFCPLRDEGTGSKPGVPDIPTDESKEELSWNSSDDEGADDQGKEVAKNDGKDDTEESEDDDEESSSDEEDDDEETRDEESFDPIPQTPESSEDEGDGEEDQGLNIGDEERLNEEEEAEELYKDVDINQRRGIQVNQEVKDSHVTLTPINPDSQQKSSSVSLQFVTSMLNPTLDAGIESIFETALTSVAPLSVTAPTMTPFMIATITTTSQATISQPQF